MEGLDLDVLRPATFARLSEVLHAAHDAGRPYHVVHFDGHGTWLDLADLAVESDAAGYGDGSAGGGGGVQVSPVIYQHGYLLFEAPGTAENQQLADGPTLGRLLAATGVPVLVLNAASERRSNAAHCDLRAFNGLSPVKLTAVLRHIRARMPGFARAIAWTFSKHTLDLPVAAAPDIWTSGSRHWNTSSALPTRRYRCSVTGHDASRLTCSGPGN